MYSFASKSSSTSKSSLILRQTLILGAVLCGWLAIAAASMLPGQIKTAVVPAQTSLPAGVAIIDRRGPLLVVQSDDPNYVRALYTNGAAFVLPARKKTCLNLQS